MSPGKPDTAPGKPGSTGTNWRFPITPRICLALAGQTFRACIRRRVLLVLALFVLFVLVSYWVAPAGFPAKRVELVIRATLMSAAFFSVIVVVFLSTTTLPEDIANRTIYTVLTKPVGRLNYLLGRTVGFAAVAIVLLGVMGVVSVGLIRYTEWQAWRTHFKDREPLQARRHARPERMALRPTSDAHDETPPVDERIGDPYLSGEWPRTMVFYFRGDELRHRYGQNVTVSFDVEVLTGERMPRCDVKLVAMNRADGRTAVVQTRLDSRRRNTVQFGPEVVDPDRGMELRLSRLTYGQILFGPDGVTVVLAPVLFEYAYAKALLMTCFGLVALIVIGLTASVYVSKWVAVVFTFSAYLLGVFSEVIHDLMTKISSGGPQGLLGTSWGAIEAQAAHEGHTHALEVMSSPAWVTILNNIYLGLFWIVTHIIPDFRVFSGNVEFHIDFDFTRVLFIQFKFIPVSTHLAAGYDVPVYLWASALEYAAVYVVLYLAVAQLFWHRREVGT